MGPEAMLRDVWARIFAKFDVVLVPAELVASNDGRVFVIGNHRGRAREGGELDAAFVHILTFADERIASLVQVTDTARWVEAMSQA